MPSTRRHDGTVTRCAYLHVVFCSARNSTLLCGPGSTTSRMCSSTRWVLLTSYMRESLLLSAQPPAPSLQKQMQRLTYRNGLKTPNRQPHAGLEHGLPSCSLSSILKARVVAAVIVRHLSIFPVSQESSRHTASLPRCRAALLPHNVDNVRTAYPQVQSASCRQCLERVGPRRQVQLACRHAPT